MSKLRAIRRQVHVEPLDEVRSEVIHLTSKAPPSRGKVLSIGSHVPDGLMKVGDVVLLQPLEGSYIQFDDAKALSLDYRHILGVVE